MGLSQTLIFAGIATLIGLAAHERFRAFTGRFVPPLLLILSLLAVYWLQPALPVRYLDFWLPTATLAFVTLTWVLTAPAEQRSARANWRTGLLVAAIVLILGLTRFLPSGAFIVPSRPPQVWQVAIGLAFITVLAIIFSRFWRPFLLTGAIVFIIIVLVILKSPVLSEAASAFLRGLNGQSVERASAFDIRWLGFSYIAFRLIHTIRDRQTGRLPNATLGEYLTYVVFFPSLTAGPIDRIERFIVDLRRPLALTGDDWLVAGERFFVGLFKKFVIADSLALIALNTTNATQVQHTFWAWVLLYAFAFQIYFDFSGYTDIVLGIARLTGVKLPENFNSPYLKPNLTQFWSNWHMTLTQWFRSYYFNPVNRWLRGLKRPPSMAIQVLIMQVSTMVLIGLWHGITINFVLWGLWHGLGLYAHNRWNDFIKAKSAAWANTSLKKQFLNISGIFVTFNFVALGWIFFALPTPGISGQFLLTLFGL